MDPHLEAGKMLEIGGTRVFVVPRVNESELQQMMKQLSNKFCVVVADLFHEVRMHRILDFSCIFMLYSIP